MINENSLLSRRESVIAAILSLAIALLTILDIIEDAKEGVNLEHLTTEGMIILVSIISMFYFSYRTLRKFKRKVRKLGSELDIAKADAESWRRKTSSFVQGLSTAIADQMDLWELSPAEKDVALLLIKGLSSKEIANIRNTSEKTVRQQAASIYQKSGLEGRAQLSAYFLEDLLAAPPITD